MTDTQNKESRITIIKTENNSIQIEVSPNQEVLETIGTLTAAQKLFLDKVYKADNE